MDLNDLFLKGVLVILVSSLLFFVYIFYTKSSLENSSIPSTQLSENEKQLLRDYFNDPAVKDNLDKTYLDKIAKLEN